MSTAPICVDTGVVLTLAVGGPGAEALDEQWRGWRASGRRLVAPPMLYCEVAAALVRVYGQALDEDARADTLRLLLGLDLELVDDPALHLRAMRLAARLDLGDVHAAYSLALAQMLDAELWTTDHELYRLVKRDGQVAVVQLVGSES